MDRNGTTDERIARGHMREQVMSRVLAAVFHGQFRSGQRLIVQQLSERYQVSTTPVREALLELAGLGVVQLLPNRGAIVRPFGPREVREISQIRRVLEVEATRSACGRIPADELSAIERELKRLGAMSPSPSWAEDARAADTTLHGMIAASCDSSRLKAEIDRYSTLWRTLRNVSQQRDFKSNYANIPASVAEHLAIVCALREADPEQAARSMDQHIRTAARWLEQALFSGPDPAPAASIAAGGSDPSRRFHHPD
jgi:DNA-binding GntR family transcriptional regulator